MEDDNKIIEETENKALEAETAKTEPAPAAEKSAETKPEPVC